LILFNIQRRNAYRSMQFVTSQILNTMEHVYVFDQEKKTALVHPVPS